MIIPRRARRPNRNAEYGLSYHMVALRQESYERLLALKAETGQPVTFLLDLAVDQFMRTAKPSA